MNEFTIVNETKVEIPELKDIKKLMDFTLEKEGITKVLFNIIIVDNKRIKELNKEYRGIDNVTDVISFALEDDETFINLDYRILGDIYISLDKTKAQALEYGHSFLRELAFLSVHGLLHLLGYDHMNEEDEKVMFNKQEVILNEYGINR